MFEKIKRPKPSIQTSNSNESILKLSAPAILRSKVFQTSVSGTFQDSYEKIMRTGVNTYGPTKLKKLSSQFGGYIKMEKTSGDSKKSYFKLYPGTTARIYGAPKVGKLTMEKMIVSINLEVNGKWAYRDVEVVKLTFEAPLGFARGSSEIINPVYIYRNRAFEKGSDGKYYARFELD